MLWVAPELLPLTLTPGIPATQKGDVYSFGIILEEIIVRGGPYEAAKQYLEPHGKLQISRRFIRFIKSRFSGTLHPSHCCQMIKVFDLGKRENLATSHDLLHHH